MDGGGGELRNEVGAVNVDRGSYLLLMTDSMLGLRPSSPRRTLRQDFLENAEGK